MGPMSDNLSPKPGTQKRERYLVDPHLQLTLALPMLAILVGVALAYIAAIYLLPGQAALDTMTAEETRSLFLRTSLIYFGLAGAALGTCAIYLTHRIAGPAGVIERAVRSMQSGDDPPRLALRLRDSLQSLAAAVNELHDRLRGQEALRQQLIEEVAARLDANDLVEARKLLVQLGGSEALSPPEIAAGV
jgi:hypothetical protein